MRERKIVILSVAKIYVNQLKRERERERERVCR